LKPSAEWPAIAVAQAADMSRRLPFFIEGCGAGSVARAHFSALASLAAISEALDITDDSVTLQCPAAERDAALAHINAALRERGLVRGWRDETYAIVDPADGQTLLARTERAASRFWGTLTFGAHCNGWVADAVGRPAALWIAQRSLKKASDPGLFDNLIGGGVPFGQTPAQTLVREGFEEAGLDRATLAAARPGRVVRLRRDIPEGLQHEWLQVFDLELPQGLQPINQDGEVARFELLPLADALALAAGDAMTVDASLVTLDFALRHALLPAPELSRLAAASASLWQPHRADSAWTPPAPATA